MSRPVASVESDFDGVQPIQAASVVSLAYDRIRTLILSGDVAPGTRLGQVDLAERLGVSRTPVREALRRLTGEGLVDFEDQRGFRVAALALDDVVRRLEVRLLLEPGAARMAAERATDEDLAALEESIARERTRAQRDRHPRRLARLPRARRRGDAEPRDGRRRSRGCGSSRSAAGCSRAARPRRAGRTPTSRSTRRSSPRSPRGDGDRAAALMEEHIRDALRHWQPELDKTREAS